MSITANRVNIETYRDTYGNSANASAYDAINGCAIAIRLTNCGGNGVFWLATHKDDERNEYILLLPSERWEKDASNNGYTLIKELSTFGHSKPTQQGNTGK